MGDYIAHDNTLYLNARNFLRPGRTQGEWGCDRVCFILQTQLGWYQHDAGHLSIFENNKLNQAYHKFLFCVLKGTSAHWWNHMHYQHHAKPNVVCWVLRKIFNFYQVFVWPFFIQEVASHCCLFVGCWNIFDRLWYTIMHLNLVTKFPVKL